MKRTNNDTSYMYSTDKKQQQKTNKKKTFNVVQIPMPGGD